MKNLITIIAVLSFTITSAFANTTPEVIISTETVEVVSIESLDFFTTATFDANTENLTFTTTKDMSVVQIFNSNGEMEFQLPVMSDNVQINKNFFDAGQYKLGFVLEGQSEVHFTDVTIR